MERTIKINAISEINKMRTALDKLEAAIRNDAHITFEWWAEHAVEEKLYEAMKAYELLKRVEENKVELKLGYFCTKCNKDMESTVYFETIEEAQKFELKSCPICKCENIEVMSSEM